MLLPPTPPPPLLLLLLVSLGCHAGATQRCPSNWTVGVDVDCCNLAQSGPHTQVRDRPTADPVESMQSIPSQSNTTVQLYS